MITSERDDGMEILVHSWLNEMDKLGMRVKMRWRVVERASGRRRKIGV